MDSVYCMCVSVSQDFCQIMFSYKSLKIGAISLNPFVTSKHIYYWNSLHFCIYTLNVVLINIFNYLFFFEIQQKAKK